MPPVFPERSLDDPALAPARRAIDVVLKGHEPFPALAIDRHWTLITANAAVAPLLSGVADVTLIEPPVNVLRLSLHANGLAPHIFNLPEWRAHLLERLRQQITATGDAVLSDLHREISAYAAPTAHKPSSPNRDFAGIAVPLELIIDGARLSFISTTTIFGTPVDITLAELAIESLFPADQATAEALKEMAAVVRDS